MSVFLLRKVVSLYKVSIPSVNVFAGGVLNLQYFYGVAAIRKNYIPLALVTHSAGGM